MEMRRITFLPLALSIILATSSACGQLPASDITPSTAGSEVALARAIETRASKVQVEGEGVVIKVLPDDHEGDRHQRFIIRLRSGRTLLVAHNIDLAPRVSALREGDTIGFYGEYEWNERGGVIHWTHADRAGRHTAGWIKHMNRVYQ